MLSFFFEAGKLKRLPRTGWLLHGISSPESIADHTFRVALITLFLVDELKAKDVDINAERALKIAILHDLAEARITDIPLDAQHYIDKKRAEKKAMMEMLLTAGEVGREYFKLFEEYEEESSLEGRLVKFADRIEMLIQAYEYEKAGFSDLDEFWNTLEKLRENEFYRYFSKLVEELAKKKE